MSTIPQLKKKDERKGGREEGEGREGKERERNYEPRMNLDCRVSFIPVLPSLTFILF